MLKIINESYIVIFFKKLSTAQQYFFTSFIIFLILFFWFLLFYMPIQNRINIFNKQIKDKNIIINKYKSKNKLTDLSISDLKNNYLNLLNKKEEKLKTINNTQEILDNFIKILNYNKLKAIEFKPIKTIEKKLYIKEYYSFKTKGNFNNIYSFFQEFKKNKLNIKFKNLELSKNSKNNILLSTNLRLIKLK